MRKLGYILLVVGFLWSAFFSLEAGPVARSYSIMNRQKIWEHKLMTAEDVADAYTKAIFQVAGFAQLGLVGNLMMFIGGGILILAKPARKPPVL